MNSWESDLSWKKKTKVIIGRALSNENERLRKILSSDKYKLYVCMIRRNINKNQEILGDSEIF